MVHMTVYPGYKEPYKYPKPRTTDPKVLEAWPKINAEIAKKTHCNKEGFCQYGMLDHAVFYPQDPDSKARLDLADYASFSMSQPGRKDVPDVFTQSIEHTDRIELWIFMAANGSLITRQDAENMVRHELSNRPK